MEYHHTPVLLDEVLEYLIHKNSGIYVDCTLGGGGHSASILEKVYKNGFLIGFDKDPEAISVSLKRLRRFSPSFLLIKGDFRDIDNWLFRIGISKVDGILSDLGISSYHVDNKERGFSFRSEVLPDMRMDQSMGESAWDVLVNSSVDTLTRIFRDYGEIKKAHDLALYIKRHIKEIKSAKDLADISKKVLPKKGRIHPATLVFQALRIYVNDELGALKEFLGKISNVLSPHGRVVIISYHSLEDRLVKDFLRDSTDFQLITKKPIKPGFEEVKRNKRARSAKMRVAEKRSE